MRRVVVLGVLLAMMLAITALQSEEVSHDPMTLAAIGFVILAAFTVSEVGSLLRLPRVTGYIVTGLALGPAAANILSADVVVEMKMFNTLALGLIATGAGLELDLTRLRKVWKTLFATVGAKVLLSGSFVVATLIGVQSALGSLSIPSQGQLISLALVLGVLSITTSPAIVLAVLDETKAKGRMSDLALGAAVLKDVVVVVLLAVVVAVSRTLLAPGAEIEAALLLDVAKEIVGSAAAGAVLGVLLILYVRYVRAEMLLFVAAMILVVSELGMALHLELLLVFIVAGFVVRNFSRHEAELANPLSLVSLPVFVLFFTNAGASVDLLTTWRILPLALAICAARAIAFFLSARTGGAVGKEPEQVRRHAWLGYLPQAGVTLGLVGLAAQQLPELAGLISSTGMAVVAINLLVGPITLRHALRITGDIAGTAPSDAEEKPPSKRPSILPEVPLEQVAAEAERAVRVAVSAIAAMQDEKLRFMAERTHTRLGQTANEFVRDVLEPWAAGFRKQLSKTLASIPKDGSLEATWVQAFPAPDMAGRGEACRRLYETMHSVVPMLPDHISVALEARHRSVRGDDALHVKVRKRLRALSKLALRREPRRIVPVRLAARVTLEPPLSSISASVLTAWCAFEAEMLEHVSTFAAGQQSRESVEDRVRSEAEAWLLRVRASLDVALSAGTASLAHVLSDVGSPTMQTTALRYSAVEPQVRDALRRLQDEPAAWTAKLDAARSGPYLAACLSHIEQAARDAIEQHVLDRSSSAVQGMVPIILTVRERIHAIRETVEEAAGPLDAKALQQDCRDAYPQRSELRVDRSGSRLRPSASVHNVALILRNVVAELPEQITTLQPHVVFRKVSRARDVATRTIRLRDLATQHMLWSFLPTLDDCVQGASSVLARANARVRDAIDKVMDALEGLGDGPEDEAQDTDEVLGALREAELRLQELETEIRATTDALRLRVKRCAQAASETMHEESTGKVAGGPPSGEPTVSARAREHLSTVTAPLRLRWVGFRTRWGELWNRLRRSALSKDIRLRLEKPVLDAASIRAYMHRWRAPMGMPDTYARFFDDEPVREHRRFTANERVYEALLAAERAWNGGAPGSALLVGKHGSGRTSLLNLCEIEMSAPRLARPSRTTTPRNTGLVGALALDLGCQPRTRHVVHALRQTRTLVFIDDLEQWLTPDATGVRELERFLNLVVRTRKEVFWLASISSEALELIEEAVPVRQAFGHVVTLQPLKLDELIRAVEGRHLLTGMEVQYPRTITSRLLGRLQRTSDRILFFRALLGNSEGNLGRALGLWLRAARLDQDGSVTLQMPQGLHVGLPFIDQMNVREIAVLVHIARFGAMTVVEVATGLGIDLDAAERHVEFLRMAGLLELADGSETEFCIPRSVRPPILTGLRNVGAWS